MPASIDLSKLSDVKKNFVVEKNVYNAEIKKKTLKVKCLLLLT